ncbi:hypothetical protein DAPPUDRAFT_331729 [Daphnia pulex]|uniref:Uncharacterized protein n=1 Tax=Daphnia pulex TaxID=6669 RepID=E9HN98_DAPPU|nr:hypothetical protein DAPPUDRAFT_331729 [Daphnia pulex]|eukprot:EFX66783.1 hypothetical protein DAPPUDRAFT_331729 [Daphnia pulex]
MDVANNSSLVLEAVSGLRSRGADAISKLNSDLLDVTPLYEHFTESLGLELQARHFETKLKTLGSKFNKLDLTCAQSDQFNHRPPGSSFILVSSQFISLFIMAQANGY